MDENFDRVKSYLIQSIYDISIFNCKSIDLSQPLINDKIDILVNYIVNEWRDIDV